jgi:hypothetical protein
MFAPEENLLSMCRINVVLILYIRLRLLNVEVFMCQTAQT